ncbi:MAG: YihY/virulence factor BrkB family protein [Candidatus Eisenbacteria bacterium]
MRPVRATFRILRTAFLRLGCERGPEAAASMSFYAVFSMFPLLLLLIAVGSRVLETADAQERLLEAVLRFLPVSRELVRQNVTAVVRVRGTVGGIGVAGLLWAATSAFSTLVRNLNRAWPSARERNLLGERLLALAMVASLVGLVLLYLVAKARVILPGDWGAAQRGAASVFGLVPSTAALSVFIMVILTLLYKWLPRTKVLWREALAGASACSLALWAGTTLFTLFLSSGRMRYNLVYGSLGTLLALLSWVYIASLLVLSGAHLAAAVAEHTRRAVVAAAEDE